jgi:xylulokinase
VIPKALIGIDIGTTAVKAVMTDLSGQRLADHAAVYPTARPAPEWVEQDPDDWLAHARAALERFAGVPAQVVGIGITSQVNTHVFCDAGFAPLASAIVWQDGRAAAEGAALDARISIEAKLAALGAPIPIDASHALSRMEWMASHRPDVWDRTVRVMAPKDWVIARLTGVAGADPIASVGLVGPDMDYAQAVLDLMPGAAARLPPLSDPLAGAGFIKEGPFRGVPLVRGTMDAWAAMFGVGVAQDGQAMNLSGTSEVLGLISATRIPVPGVITFPAWRGITLHAGPTQAGGASLDWLGRIMGREAADLAALARGGVIRADSPLFLPHLQGERAPLWDMAARGTFAGLSAATGPAEMVLSVMEGVAFSARLALEALEQAGGLRADVIRAGGGGTASDDWCRIRADAFGRPLLRMAARDAGAVGALVMAGAGLGLMPDLAEAAERLVQQDRQFTPDPLAIALADERFAIWRALYDQVRPVHARLGAAR